MKSSYPLIVALLLLHFSACKKNESLRPTATSQPDITKLSDSCSYSIDEAIYTCNKLTSTGKGNAGANLDTASKRYDNDTVQYRNSYGLISSEMGSSAEAGSLVIRFVKKYAKSQLIRNVGYSILGPISDTTLYYPTSELSFAVDYERFNKQSGIVLEARNNLGSKSEILVTNISKSPYQASSLGDDCQKDSKFDVIHLYNLPGGGHLLEAKFTANVFDNNERPKRLTDGYLRIHID